MAPYRRAPAVRSAQAWGCRIDSSADRRVPTTRRGGRRAGRWLSPARPTVLRRCPRAGWCRRRMAMGEELRRLTADGGRPVELDALALLAERAAAAGLTRQGRRSCGGACELLPTADGWLAVSLPRPEDAAMVPAWLRSEGSLPALVAGRSSAELVASAADLGLAVAALGETDAAARAPVVATPGAAAAGPRADLAEAVVVDLSSLWAGPVVRSRPRRGRRQGDQGRERGAARRCPVGPRTVLRPAPCRPRVGRPRPRRPGRSASPRGADRAGRRRDRVVPPAGAGPARHRRRGRGRRGARSCGSRSRAMAGTPACGRRSGTTPPSPAASWPVSRKAARGSAPMPSPIRSPGSPPPSPRSTGGPPAGGGCSTCRWPPSRRRAPVPRCPVPRTVRSPRRGLASRPGRRGRWAPTPTPCWPSSSPLPVRRR